MNKKKEKKILLHSLLKLSKIKFNVAIKNINIETVTDISRAKKNSITFFSNIKYLELLKKTKASAIIISKKYKKYLSSQIVPIFSETPIIDFAKILCFFYPNNYFSKISFSNLSIVDIKKKYKNLKFGSNFHVEENVIIGKNVFIGNNVIIKKNCKIGNNVIIGSNVIIENTDIHNNVHICDSVILGKKGFGFKFVNNKCIRIPHIGKVIINDGVEIGSFCVIDRGSVGDTVIGANTFLDNFVHIAHNVRVGKRCIFAAQSGVAGSTIIGNNVTIGGQAGISGHLKIGDNVKIGGKTGVIKNVLNNETVMGYPAKSFREFIRTAK
jgi:UDP-3-O-[3-hydroxymyristoyl] glucosamine N-acyltransferase